MDTYIQREITSFFSSFLARKQSGNLLVLDGMRGFALLLVLFSHMGLGGIKAFGLIDFSGIGKAGVFLFFVLSSYLLTRQIIKTDWKSITVPQYWLKYFIRRFLRIYPLYFLVLLVFMILGVLGYLKFNLEDVIKHLLLLEGLRHFWAIPVEFKFYFLLPFVALSLKFLFQYTRYAWVSFVLVILLMSQHKMTEINSIDLIDYLQIFLLGSVIAGIDIYLNSQILELKMLRLALRISAYISAVGLLITVPSLWSWLIGVKVAFYFFHKDVLMYGVLWSTILLFSIQGESYIASFFSLAFFRFFGAISFSVYLWHPIFLRPFMWAQSLGDVSKTIGFLVSIALIGLLSYVFIEKKFLRMAPR